MQNYEAPHAFPMTPEGRPVEPTDIDTSTLLVSSFGEGNAEIAAQYIVMLCQEKGGWEPFTEEEIIEFYDKQCGIGRFDFSLLIDPIQEWGADGKVYERGGGYIERNENGTLQVTPDFISQAYIYNPQE